MSLCACVCECMLLKYTHGSSSTEADTHAHTLCSDAHQFMMDLSNFQDKLINWATILKSVHTLNIYKWVIALRV